MSYLLSILIVITGVAVVMALRAYVALRAKSAVDFGKYSRSFYSDVKALVEDDETPHELLLRVAVMNETICNRKAAMVLASFPTRRIPSYSRNATAKVLTEFFVHRPELERVYHNSLGAWFLAVTAYSPLIGLVARYAISEDSIDAAATDFVRTAHCEDGNGGGPMNHSGALPAH